MLAAFAGFLAGTVHVWAGPDHLAAVAPLAVRGRRRSWVAGLRWGLGHSAGVALVGVLALVLRELLPIERLSAVGERLVGVMLIGIGLWGLRKAIGRQVHLHGHEHDGQAHVHIHVHDRETAHNSPGAHVHAHAAFGIGVLHGLAGSSHFLGVLPALAFPTMIQAVGYIIAYGCGTIVSMMVFAGLMGLVASRFALDSLGAYRGLLGTCSVAALAVGAFWLVA